LKRSLHEGYEKAQWEQITETQQTPEVRARALIPSGENQDAGYHAYYDSRHLHGKQGEKHPELGGRIHKFLELVDFAFVL
jgi:hypothetical protein